MTVNYRVWLKDREKPKSRMQFVVTKYFVDDILETAHDMMLQYTDIEWICYRVNFISIAYFDL